MSKLAKIGLMMEIGGIVTLAGMLIKTEYERHKTKRQLFDAEILNHLHNIKEICYEAEIRSLNKELDELKSQEKEEEA